MARSYIFIVIIAVNVSDNKYIYSFTKNYKTS